MEAGVDTAGAPDWDAPWFTPWSDTGQAALLSWLSGQPPHSALNAVAVREAGAQAAIRFVPQQALPRGEAYESYIFRTGTCPTRDNLHDFFNGLVWIRFPRTKRALNRLQAAEIERAGTAGSRGRVRDAITVFDENGALLHAPHPLWDALRAREWRRLFVDLRPLWSEARLLVFGHALLEKLAAPRKDLTAHVWAAPMGGQMRDWDAHLAGQLTAERLAQKPFTPLPVMGVPGWCAENQNFSFYDQSLIFRPAGRQKNS